MPYLVSCLVLFACYAADAHEISIDTELGGVRTEHRVRLDVDSEATSSALLHSKKGASGTRATILRTTREDGRVQYAIQISAVSGGVEKEWMTPVLAVPEAESAEFVSANDDQGYSVQVFVTP